MQCSHTDHCSGNIAERCTYKDDATGPRTGADPEFGKRGGGGAPF